MFDDLDLDCDGDVDSEDDFLADCLLLELAERHKRQDVSMPIQPVPAVQSPDAAVAAAVLIFSALCLLIIAIS